VDTFGLRLTGFQGSVLKMRFTVQTQASTTCSMRILEFGTSAATNVVALLASSNGIAQLEWDLAASGIDGTWDGTSETPVDATFLIQMKRDTGANSGLIYRPTVATIGSPSLLGGNPAASALTFS